MDKLIKVIFLLALGILVIAFRGDLVKYAKKFVRLVDESKVSVLQKIDELRRQ